MSKNLVIGAKTYEGVSTVNFNTSDNGVAVFKDVDEMTSGIFDIPTELTLAGTNNTGEDMTLNAFFSANEVIVGAKEFIIFKLEGDTAPTTTSYTWKTFMICFTSIGRNDAQFTVLTGSTSQVAPSTITGHEGVINAPGSAYCTRNSAGVLSISESITKHCIPAGASVYYARYPISWDTGLMHE